MSGDPRISIIGLGKLGASMAAAMASRGLQVIGVDVDQKAVQALKQGRAPAQETDLAETIAANRDRLQATASHLEAVKDSDISFVIVPTPSDKRGAFSLQYTAWAFREIGRALAQKEAYHLVVLTSTVLPGASRYGLLPILESHAGKSCGPQFGFCYSPEFIALGSVIRDFLNPDFTLVGQYDQRSGDLLEQCYQRVLCNQAPCKRMSIENAELAKLALNTFITTKITYANMLADICQALPGGDVDAVSDAIGSDSRVGPKYLRGGLGYGGPCFPRDNKALSFFMRQLGLAPLVPEATETGNQAIVGRLVDMFDSHCRRGDSIAVLGLAYKPHSHIVEQSQGLQIAEALMQRGARVVAYDPLAGSSANEHLGGRVLILGNARECIAQAEVVLITTPDPEFRNLEPKDFSPPRRLVVDCWRFLEDRLAGQEGIEYQALGSSRHWPGDCEPLLQELWGKAKAVS